MSTMTDFLMHPAAAQALGEPRPWTLAELRTAFATETFGVVAALTARIEPSDTPIEYPDLETAAQTERIRVGGYYLRPEYFLLGAVALLSDDDTLEKARADYQTLLGDNAYREYLRLEPQHPGDRTPTAILVGGLPGTGKSTLAESLSQALRAPVFSMDWQLGALVPFAVLRNDNMVPLADLSLIAAMARQLQLGLDVIVDALGHEVEARRRIQEIAEALGARFVGVECVCSDEDLQRTRLEGRSRGIPGWPATVSWEHVQRMRGLWEPWQEPHLVVDSAVDAPEAGLKRILDAIPR